jgi:hypothetical protein
MRCARYVTITVTKSSTHADFLHSSNRHSIRWEFSTVTRSFISKQVTKAIKEQLSVISHPEVQLLSATKVLQQTIFMTTTPLYCTYIQSFTYTWCILRRKISGMETEKCRDLSRSCHYNSTPHLQVGKARRIAW